MNSIGRKWPFPAPAESAAMTAVSVGASGRASSAPLARWCLPETFSASREGGAFNYPPKALFDELRAPRFNAGYLFRRRFIASQSKARALSLTQAVGNSPALSLSRLISRPAGDGLCSRWRFKGSLVGSSPRIKEELAGGEGGLFNSIRPFNRSSRHVMMMHAGNDRLCRRQS